MRAAVRTGLLGWTITFTDKHPAPHDGRSGAGLGPKEVLVKVKSAAINPVDYKLPRLAAGKVVGIDLSGTVEEVGSDVSEFSAGDPVFGRAMRAGGFSGSIADYAVADAKCVARKPGAMSFDDAAGLPTAYLTGIHSLRAGGMGARSAVLVVGASGGCGLAGVQLALATGASRVVGICSGGNFDFVREMAGQAKGGVLELVDYKTADAMEKFKKENVKKFDCIYDTATGSGKGEDYSSTLPELLREGTGTYIQINGGPSVWAKHFSGKEGPRRKLVVTEPGGRADLAEIASLLEDSGARPHVNLKSFDAAGVREGFEMLRSRRTKGKIVFRIN